MYIIVFHYILYFIPFNISTGLVFLNLNWLSGRASEVKFTISACSNMAGLCIVKCTEIQQATVRNVDKQTWCMVYKVRILTVNHLILK